MKKHKIKMLLTLAILSIAAGIAVYAFHPFFKKTYLEYELVYALPQGGGPYPAYNIGVHYQFFHSKQDMASNSNFLKNFTIPYSDYDDYGYKAKYAKDKQNKEALFKTFDFDQYSYVAFTSHKISSMYYSDKTTYFNDQSSPVNRCRKRKKICVFVTYDLNSVYGHYIYRVKRNELLRGFFING